MKDVKIKKVIRWIARLLGIGIAALLAFFLIAETITSIIEGDFGNTMMSQRDIIALICIPGVLFIGILLSWFKEILGGILILASFLLFNINSLLFETFDTFSVDFWFVFLLGVLTIVSGILYRSKKKE